jgi:cell surface protein SprA
MDQSNRALGDSIWAGLMYRHPSSEGFSQSPLDLSQYEYLDIWINDFHQEPEERFGRLHIDLGMMSEDYWDPESNELDSEDRSNLGVFDELEEDTGLDGIYDPGEMFTDNPYADPSDPAGDNWEVELQSETYPNSYFKINGTEGNRRLDTEDWNGNHLLDQYNSYYSISVGLDEPALVDMVEVYENETGTIPEHSKAWRLYRVYLSEAEICMDEFEIPLDWNQIQGVRVWLEGMNHSGGSPLNKLEIADIRFGDVQSPPW